MPTSKVIHLLWEEFDNVQPKPKKSHKRVSGIKIICGENMILVGNKCMILKRRHDEKPLIKNQLQLAFCEPLKNMGYMNETHNIMFWIRILITVSQTIQCPHIDHIYEMLMMNEVCVGKKLNFIKNSFLVIY